MLTLAIYQKDNGLWSSYIRTYDVSMKSRPKGHIAVKSSEAHPKTSSKNTSHNVTLLRFCNNRSDNRKDLTLRVFPKDFCRRLVFPLTTFQSTFISGAPNNGFHLNTMLITLFKLSRVLLDV